MSKFFQYILITIAVVIMLFGFIPAIYYLYHAFESYKLHTFILSLAFFAVLVSGINIYNFAYSKLHGSTLLLDYFSSYNWLVPFTKPKRHGRVVDIDTNIPFQGISIWILGLGATLFFLRITMHSYPHFTYDTFFILLGLTLFTTKNGVEISIRDKRLTFYLSILWVRFNNHFSLPKPNYIEIFATSQPRRKGFGLLKSIQRANFSVYYNVDLLFANENKIILYCQGNKKLGIKQAKRMAKYLKVPIHNRLKKEDVWINET